MIEQKKHHTVRLQKSLAKEQHVHEQRVQELITESKQHNLHISCLESRLGEDIKQTFEKKNVSFTVQVISDIEILQSYTGFDSVK